VTARHPLLNMSEAELQTNVVDAARRLGGVAYHTHDSRRSAEGFPDLVILFPRTGGLLFAELKSATGKVTRDQQRWLDGLRVGHREVYLWRPADWPNPIVPTLQRLASAVLT
jgi:hypothetical protein